MDKIMKVFENQIVIAFIVEVINDEILTKRSKINMNGEFQLEEVSKNNIIYKFNNGEKTIYIKYQNRQLRDMDRSDYDYLKYNNLLD